MSAYEGFETFDPNEVVKEAAKQWNKLWSPHDQEPWMKLKIQATYAVKKV